MKIEIATHRDGAGIKLDGVLIGRIEKYRGGPAYIKFMEATSDGTSYGVATEAVARLKYGRYADAKRYATKLLKAAKGDYVELARRAAEGTWGDALIESFA